MKLPNLTLGMVGILGLFCYLPAAQAGPGSIIGDEDNQYIQKAVTGDFNGDGTLDVVVCSEYTNRTTPAAEDCTPEDPDDPECDGMVEENIGAVYIFTSAVGHNTPLSAADGVIYGKDAGDFFGWDCANAGDYNGDGVEDLVVGAPSNDDGGEYAGAVYVIPGSANILDIADIEDSTVKTIIGATSAGLGTDVAGIGDTDSDGWDDVIIRDAVGEFCHPRFREFKHAAGQPWPEVRSKANPTICYVLR